MAISPWAYKLLIGIGGVSAVSVGGIAIKQGYFTKENKSSDENINYLEKLNLPSACNSPSKSCSLTQEDLNKLRFIFDSSIKGNPSVSSGEADLTWKTITGPDNATYEFTIKAKTSDIDLGVRLSSISIPSTGSGMKFGIKEEIISANQKEYYLQLDQSSKELSAGMNCKNGSCTKSGEENINGLNSDYTITPGIAEDTTRYPGWYKYKVKSDSVTANEEDGYYKLEFDSTSKKWKLTKVDDLLSKWDESILTKGEWSAKKEGSSNNKLKVTVTETDAEINGTDKQSWTWECEITLNNSSGDTNLENQLNNLKTKLGITGDESTTTDLQKRKFVENCAKNRDDSQKITNETLKGSPNKLESTFTVENGNFEKLFTEKIKGTRGN